MSRGKYDLMDIGELCRHAGFREESAQRLETTVQSLIDIGMMQRHWMSDGLGFDIRRSLSALADLRSKMPIQPGMRVEVREDCMDELVERWKRYDQEAMRETFSCPGTVLSVNYNGSWGVWVASVEFDFEFHRRFGSGGSLVASTEPGYYGIDVEMLEPEHVYV